MKRLVLTLVLLAGCAQSGSTPTTPSGGPTCEVHDGYSPTPTDEKGRYLASISHGATTTFKVCGSDGKERVISISDVKVGSIDDNQDAFLTDGKGHILTRDRIVTLSQTPTKLGDLEVTGRCLVMWDGGCDPAPAAPAAAPAANPAPAPEPTATGTPAAAPAPNPS